MSVSKPALPSAVRISRGHDGTPLEVGGVWPQLKRKQLLRPNLPQNGVRWQMVLLGSGPSRTVTQTSGEPRNACSSVCRRLHKRLPGSEPANQGRLAGSACDERDRHFFTGSLHRLRPRLQNSEPEDPLWISVASMAASASAAQPSTTSEVQAFGSNLRWGEQQPRSLGISSSP